MRRSIAGLPLEAPQSWPNVSGLSRGGIDLVREPIGETVFATDGSASTDAEQVPRHGPRKHPEQPQKYRDDKLNCTLTVEVRGNSCSRIDIIHALPRRE
jgi:hypothetical protein